MRKLRSIRAALLLVAVFFYGATGSAAATDLFEMALPLEVESDILGQPRPGEPIEFEIRFKARSIFLDNQAPECRKGYLHIEERLGLQCLSGQGQVIPLSTEDWSVARFSVLPTADDTSGFVVFLKYHCGEGRSLADMRYFVSRSDTVEIHPDFPTLREGDPGSATWYRHKRVDSLRATFSEKELQDTVRFSLWLVSEDQVAKIRTHAIAVEETSMPDTYNVTLVRSVYLDIWRNGWHFGKPHGSQSANEPDSAERERLPRPRQRDGSKPRSALGYPVERGEVYLDTIYGGLGDRQNDTFAPR